jgi:hypothetical protein
MEKEVFTNRVFLYVVALGYSDCETELVVHRMTYDEAAVCSVYSLGGLCRIVQ